MNTQPRQALGVLSGVDKQLIGVEKGVSVQGQIATIQGGACLFSSSGCPPGFWTITTPHECLGSSFRSASNHLGLDTAQGFTQKNPAVTCLLGTAAPLPAEAPEA